jgi:hypothetical protein
MCTVHAKLAAAERICLKSKCRMSVTFPEMRASSAIVTKTRRQSSALLSSALLSSALLSSALLSYLVRGLE